MSSLSSPTRAFHAPYTWSIVCHLATTRSGDGMPLKRSCDATSADLHPRTSHRRNLRRDANRWLHREASSTKGKRPRRGPDSKYCSVCQVLAQCVHTDIHIATAMPPERKTCFNTCRQVVADVGHENRCASEGRRRNATESQKQSTVSEE